MSAHLDLEVSPQAMNRPEVSAQMFAAIATVFAVLGVSSIWPTVFYLWDLWTGDALKSIGMVVPLVSLVLILRVWRNLGWRAEGTWWGLLLLIAASAVAQIQRQGVLILVVSPSWSTTLPPPSLVLLAYGSGVVLLFGGVRLYRAALFPILLLWFVNPVPHVFSLIVDMPLQRVSADIARSFAIHLGYPLTPDHLRLMFTPEFGMFIAPGCNGIRGSITMGFIALIAGYVYRFRWYATGFVVMCAIILGYLFNLARLCFLVVYYVIAMHAPSLQGKAENADYLIGAVLFLLATVLLFTVVQRLRDSASLKASDATPVSEKGGVVGREQSLRYARLFAMGVIVLLGWTGLLRAHAAGHSPSTTVADARSRFPERIGGYDFARSWYEEILPGRIGYIWGEYRPVQGGLPIAVGVSPALGWHDPLICHTVRGEHPLWQGPLRIATADAAPISFSSAFYSDGVTQYLEASTQCSDMTCGEFATERTHLGFIFTPLDPKSIFDQSPQRPIPILLRAETTDTALSADAARQQLTEELRTFLASLSLGDLTKPYNR